MSGERSNLLDKESGGTGERYEQYVRPILAEFVGVTLFVCFGCLCVLNSGNASPAGTVPFSASAIALGHGMTIFVLVTAFADVSGAHLNPAVTAGILMVGGIGPVKALFYVCAQLLGGLTGAALARGILPSAMFEAIGGGAQTLASGVTVGQGILCEVVLTTVLVLTVFMTAVDSKTKSSLFPLAIGLAVSAGILAGVMISGASMNPARSFGPAVVIAYSTSKFWTYHYVYWVGPFLGSVVAAVWYRLFLASSENRLVFKE